MGKLSLELEYGFDVPRPFIRHRPRRGQMAPAVAHLMAQLGTAQLFAWPSVRMVSGAWHSRERIFPGASRGDRARPEGTHGDETEPLGWATAAQQAPDDAGGILAGLPSVCHALRSGRQ